MLESFFLYGKFIKINTPIKIDKNVKIGNAYIGFIENIAIMRQ
jgi:hypothetical protein